jgi:fumarate hydratase subunit alpha
METWGAEHRGTGSDITAAAVTDAIKSVVRKEVMSDIRQVDVAEITEAIKEMCISANHGLSEDMREQLQRARAEETSDLGVQILQQLEKNLIIAKEDRIPICQDTGMAIVFIDLGQDVHLQGGDLTEAVNEGVRRGYLEGYLRKSVVADPLLRENTKDNTPAILHTRIVPGREICITVAPKGFGSENMSRVFMLKPADGEEGVVQAVVQAVKDAGPNACPPMVVGVGIGGDFEECALMAKRALTLNTKEHSMSEHIRVLEERILEKINQLGLGPAGLGGSQTALSVRILTYPTHIAGLPVGVNICCHVNRHETRVL